MRRRPGAPDESADHRAPRAGDAAATERAAVTKFETRMQRVADSTYIVSVAGEIDLFTGPPFAAAVSGALDAGATRLIVDLSDCAFIDSTGITVLVRANERHNHSSKPVAVVNDHPNVLKVLRITGVDAILGLYPSRSAALNGSARD
jgi:anti-sigma B factor antagonist